MKTLVLLSATAVLLLLACGQEAEPEFAPPPQAPTSAPDIQATVAAGVQATAEAEAALAAKVQATIEALPTSTRAPEPPATHTPEPTSAPEPTATNIPEPTATYTPEPTRTPDPTATNTPAPTSTPAPTATNTPMPTSAPEPTATAEPTGTPEPTAIHSATPIPVGHRLQRAFAFNQYGFISNTDPPLKLRVQRAYWGNEAEDVIQEYNDRGNIRSPRGYQFVLIRLQVTNEGMKPGTYDAYSRLRLVSGNPAEADFLYELGDGKACDDIPQAYRSGQVITHVRDENTYQAHICFVVKSEDAGDAILWEDGGANASPADWRYWKLRGN